VTISSNAASGDSISTWSARTTTSVEEDEVAPAITVSPQPASDMLTISLSDGAVRTVDVKFVNLSGVVVLEWSGAAVTGGGVALSVSSLTAGTYTLVVKSGDRTSARNVVIVR